MIWILTDEVWVPVAERVTAELSRRGMASLTLSPGVCEGLTVEIDDGRLSVFLDERELTRPDAVLYLRDPVPQPAPDSGLGNAELEFVNDQWRIMLRGLVTALEITGTPVLNSVASILVDEKTAQLLRAARLGFVTPRALHGANPSRAGAFARAVGDRCATKPFLPFVRLSADGTCVQRLLTNVVSTDELRRGLEGASVPSPTIVQPFIEAPFEHRVVVVGERVFSARTARAGGNAVDVRRLPVTRADVTAGTLPDDVAQRCVALVRDSGLYMAAIDVLERGDGTYVFLDLNPSGHFLWVEQLTGAPICAALGDLLIGVAQGAIASPTTSTGVTRLAG